MTWYLLCVVGFINLISNAIYSMYLALCATKGKLKRMKLCYKLRKELITTLDVETDLDEETQNEKVLVCIKGKDYIECDRHNRKVKYTDNKKYDCLYDKRNEKVVPVAELKYSKQLKVLNIIGTVTGVIFLIVFVMWLII